MDLLTLSDKIVNRYLKKKKMNELVKWLIAEDLAWEVLQILLKKYHKIRNGKMIKKINLDSLTKKLIKEVKPHLERLIELQPFYKAVINKAKENNIAEPIINFLEKYKNSSIDKVREDVFHDL